MKTQETKNLKINYHMLGDWNHEMNNLLSKLPFNNEMYNKRNERR